MVRALLLAACRPYNLKRSSRLTGEQTGVILQNPRSTLRALSYLVLALKGNLTFSRYDYGAPIREDRTLSPKYSEIKLQAYFLHASPDFLIATRSDSGTAFSNNTNIYTTVLSSSTGVNFYVVRQATNSYVL